MSMISFKGIIPNAEAVRVTVIAGVPHLWAVDLVMAITGKDRNDANETLRDLKDDFFDKGRFIVKKIAGNGKWEVRLLTLPDAFDFVLVLPGPTARSIRMKVGNYMVRILGGDPKLIREIEDNAASDAPLPKLARASMKSGPRAAALESDQPPIKKVCVEIDAPELITRGQSVCKLYERYKMTSGGDIAVEVRQEYTQAMQNIFQCLNPINDAAEKTEPKLNMDHLLDAEKA